MRDPMQQGDQPTPICDATSQPHALAGRRPADSGPSPSSSPEAARLMPLGLKATALAGSVKRVATASISLPT